MLYIYILLVLLAILIVKLIVIRILFKNEIKATLNRDPAARGSVEVMISYAGLHALMFHKVSSLFFKMKVPVLPRMVAQFARFLTGIEIHPGAKIGKGLFIDHGTGVVIGETSQIGDNVTMFQGVTLGGTGKERGKRHPTIGNNVVIGAGAKILGDINVGNNVNIGANAVVIKDVPDDSTVVGVPGRIARKEGRKVKEICLDHTNLPDPLSQSLERIQKEIELIEEELHHPKKED